jgi:hypothetical protein
MCAYFYISMLLIQYDNIDFSKTKKWPYLYCDLVAFDGYHRSTGIANDIVTVSLLSTLPTK